ncbi:MAG: bifunctional NADH-specific enoyl-ACP reductase/trans-2-enoyl-CoA reductase, partial [Pseudomonadales bacterium]|nr:bifunctional NADH-specific enoyl-ACP reductase/trans-2-enoyl-CoA reductase [Pseudomonadales bacterium]
QGVVTQASSAIPIMPLYLSLLFKIARQRGEYEGCIEQIYALFAEGLYGNNPRVDEEGRLRLDHKEMQAEVQQAIEALWDKVSDENLRELTDFSLYQKEFLGLFGFEVDGVDYNAEVNPEVEIDACESVGS